MRCENTQIFAAALVPLLQREKTAEKDALYREYNTLKDETQKVEQIRRSVADILRTEPPEQTSQKSRGMEL